jgi:hypothetical protein
MKKERKEIEKRKTQERERERVSVACKTPGKRDTR